MKTNEKKDLQTKTKDELVKLLKDAQSALVQLKLSHQQAKLQNTSEITNTRKRIAVLKTVLQGRSLEVPSDASLEDQRALDDKKAEVKETKKKEGK